MRTKSIIRNGGNAMHKSLSPVSQESITYAKLPDGTVDVWIRANEVRLPELAEGEEGVSGYECDEVFCRLSTSDVTKEEIAEDIDFWFKSLKDMEDGCMADHLGKERFKAEIRAKLSEACQNTIYDGVDVELSTGIEHFSLTPVDQTNLFGKQAELAAGAEKCAYHKDADVNGTNPCVYYSAADMQKILKKSMEFVTFNTTYCNSLFVWLDNLTKSSEMAALKYGAEIPLEFQSEVLSDFTKAGVRV